MRVIRRGAFIARSKDDQSKSGHRNRSDGVLRLIFRTWFLCATVVLKGSGYMVIGRLDCESRLAPSAMLPCSEL